MDKYDILLMKYNNLIAKYKDEQNRHRVREQEWQQWDENVKVTFDYTNDLCEKILSKDRSTITPDGKFEWSRFSMKEKVIAAIRSYDKYVENRRTLLEKIMNDSESRREEIEGLREQISFYETHISSNPQNYEAYKLKKEEKEKLNKAIDVAGSEIQRAVNEGNIEVALLKDAISNGNAVISDYDAGIFDDEDDFFPATISVANPKMLKKKNVSPAAELITETIKDKNKAKITKSSMQVKNSQRMNESIEHANKHATKAASAEMNEKINERLCERDKFILEIIGSTGLSDGGDIVRECLTVAAERQYPLTEKAVRSSFVPLKSVGFLKCEKCITPYKQTYVYYLSPEGTFAYKTLTGKAPKMDERSKIIKEHDNLEHGYAIKQVAERIEKTGHFQGVSIYNRKHAIYIDNDTKRSYIADIICHTSHNKIYIEYERGFHTDKNFAEKCDKMLIATGQINFIVANKDEAEKMMARLMKWVSGKHPNDLMKNLTIRVTTTAIDYCNLVLDEDWLFTFKPFRDETYSINKIKTRA